ncbi:MAG: porin [Pseudomonadota bacterium]
MKKHLIAVAVAAAVAAPAAMADTTLYGLAHVSVDYIDNDALADANVNVQSGSSRLGVKGTEKLSNGLSALYQMEFGVDMSDSSSSTFSARNQFVGLTGGFGTLVAGRHDTPMKLAIAKYDLFGDQIGDNGNATLYNIRAANVVAYMLPSNLGGFNGTVAYVADLNPASLNDLASGGVSTTSADNNDFQAYNVQLGYEHKIFTIDGVYQSWDLANETYTDWMIGAGVKFGGLKVNALYQKPDSDILDADLYGLGAAYTFGNNTIKGQYYTANVDGLSDDPTMWALGYDYKMSKQTTVYAAYGQGKDGFNVVGDGHGGKTGVSKVGGIDTYNGADVSAFSVGVKHSF